MEGSADREVTIGLNIRVNQASEAEAEQAFRRVGDSAQTAQRRAATAATGGVAPPGGGGGYGTPNVGAAATGRAPFGTYAGGVFGGLPVQSMPGPSAAGAYFPVPHVPAFLAGAAVGTAPFARGMIGNNPMAWQQGQQPAHPANVALAGGTIPGPVPGLPPTSGLQPHGIPPQAAMRTPTVSRVANASGERTIGASAHEMSIFRALGWIPQTPGFSAFQNVTLPPGFSNSPAFGNVTYGSNGQAMIQSVAGAFSAFQNANPSYNQFSNSPAFGNVMFGAGGQAIIQSGPPQPGWASSLWGSLTQQRQFSGRPGSLWNGVVGGRPRGIAGLASVAGVGYIAGEIAQHQRRNVELENEFGFGISPQQATWEFAEGIPILGAGVRPVRNYWGDILTREAIVGTNRRATREGEIEGRLRGVQSTLADHRQHIRQGVLGAEADAAAASHFNETVRRPGVAGSFLTRDIMERGESAELGHYRKQRAEAQAELSGGQTHAASLAVEVGKRRATIGKAEGNAAFWNKEASGATARIATIEKLLVDPLDKNNKEVWREYLFQNRQPGETDAELARRYRPLIGGDTGNRELRNFLKLDLAGQKTALAEAQKFGVGWLDRAQEEGGRLGKDLEAQKAVNMRVAEAHRDIGIANLNIQQQNQQNVLTMQERTLQAGTPNWMTMGPGRRAANIDSIRRVMATPGMASTVDWERAFSTPEAQEMAMRQADANMPQEVTDLRRDLGFRGGNIAGTRNLVDALGADIERAKAAIQKAFADATKNITDEAADNLAKAITAIAAKAGDKIRKEGDIGVQQKRDQAAVGAGGGR